MRWKNLFRGGPPLGTPENPEIIDARLPRSHGRRGPILLQLLFGILVASIPGLLFGSTWYWLFKIATTKDELLAWLFLLLLSPPTLLFVAFAVLADLALLLILLLTLLGKKTVIWGKFPDPGV